MLARVTAQTLEPRRPPGRVSLRPLTLADAPRVRAWMASPEVIRFTVVVPGPEYGPLSPYSTAEADQYLTTLVGDPTRKSWAVELDGAHVGNVGIKDWLPGASTAECFIELGEDAARGRGVGTRAMRLLLDEAFGSLRLGRVRLGVFEFNHRAIGLYRKLGFADDGHYGWHWVDGRYWEILAMSLERSRWVAS